MEGKILKGEARGGLVEVTRRKEEQLARREQELQRRCGNGPTMATAQLLQALWSSTVSQARCHGSICVGSGSPMDC